MLYGPTSVFGREVPGTAFLTHTLPILQAIEGTGGLMTVYFKLLGIPPVEGDAVNMTQQISLEESYSNLERSVKSGLSIEFVTTTGEVSVRDTKGSGRGHGGNSPQSETLLPPPPSVRIELFCLFFVFVLFVCCCFLFCFVCCFCLSGPKWRHLFLLVQFSGPFNEDILSAHTEILLLLFACYHAPPLPNPSVTNGGSLRKEGKLHKIVNIIGNFMLGH